MKEHDTTKCDQCQNSDALKVYIGRGEAYEILLTMPSFERLPRTGREYLMVYSIAEKAAKGINDFALGKDEQGYYTRAI